MTLEFVVLYVPVVAALFLLFFVVLKTCDKVEALQQRCDAIELVDQPVWNGQLAWDDALDEFLLDGLRGEAGDPDDTKRRQFEAIAMMDLRRH